MKQYDMIPNTDIPEPSTIPIEFLNWLHDKAQEKGDNVILFEDQKVPYTAGYKASGIATYRHLMSQSSLSEENHEKTKRDYLFGVSEGLTGLKAPQEQDAPINEGWISVDTPPEFMKDQTYSENVFVVWEGKVEVMAQCSINDGEETGRVWCNCYGDIYGEPQYDADYHPTFWREIPKPPISVTK